MDSARMRDLRGEFAFNVMHELSRMAALRGRSDIFVTPEQMCDAMRHSCRYVPSNWDGRTLFFGGNQVRLIRDA